MKRWVGPGIAALVTLGLAYGALISSGWAVFWFSLLAVGGVVETVALVRRAPGDTFSETVWETTDKGWARTLLAIFLGWLTWHLVWDKQREKDAA